MVVVLVDRQLEETMLQYLLRALPEQEKQKQGRLVGLFLFALSEQMFGSHNRSRGGFLDGKLGDDHLLLDGSAAHLQILQ